MSRRWAGIGVAVLLGCAPSIGNVDLASPQVVSVLPQLGATGVALTAAVAVCFDRAMQAATASSATLDLSRMDGTRAEDVPGAVALSTDGTCALFTPAAKLSPLSNYRLELKKGLLSVAGIALSSKTVGFATTFRTGRLPVGATLLMPENGALAAPLDLASVKVAFSGPVQLTDDGGAFILTPGGTVASLSADGTSAVVEVQPAAGGTAFSLAFDPALVDLDGQPLALGTALGFTLSSCPEESAPSVGVGTVVARDRDAILTFLVDRPTLCSATLNDPGCADAGALESAAVCQVPYDPCAPGLACTCTVSLVGLCPSDSFWVAPQAAGGDGLSATSDLVAVATSAPLPALVLTEVFGGEAASAFVEVQNRGPTPIDLLGLSLLECDGTIGCAEPKSAQTFGAFGGPLSGAAGQGAVAGTTVLAPGAYALLVDPLFAAIDGAAGALLLSPQAGASLLKLSDDKPQALGLQSPGAPAPDSTARGVLRPEPGLSLERIDPTAPDSLPGNWALSGPAGGTPGSCNSSMPGTSCAP